MKRARDFRRSAFDALRGRWGLALVVSLLASLFGVSGSNFGANFTYSSPSSSSGESAGESGFAFENLFENVRVEILPIILIVCSVVLVISLSIAAAYFVLGSVVTLGYSKFNLAVIDAKEARVSNLFDYFKFWKNAALTQLLRFVYIFLWSLLLIIPGIIASYSYSMTPYILAEFPEISPKEAIRTSKKLMYGNKYRLFCLEWSFIGWHILAILSLGIGYLWLTPYINAAKADFYREISDTRPRVDIPLDDFFVNPNEENRGEF